MGKTIFDDTPPLGTIVTDDFLNAINTHRHTGEDVDGAGILDYAASTGSANAYILTLSPALAAHIAGMPIRFKANFTNTGAATLNINGLGAVALKKNYSVALSAGDIVSGQIITVNYDGTNYQVLNGVVVYASDLSSLIASGPAMPKIDEGVGQWLALVLDESLDNCHLPAGGTWAYFGSNFGTGFAGVAAGGSSVWSGSASNFFGFCWRIT